MKVAQFVATIPGALPQEYAAQLMTLQIERAADGCGLRATAHGGRTGPGLGKKFASFDREAAAAASLGQVHRAMAKDGAKLACKLQYPDMAAAVDSDIRQFKRVRAQPRLRRRPSTRAKSPGNRRPAAEELDYVREAAHMRLYALMLADRDDIAVPEPVRELSTKRLLTMSWLDGTTDRSNSRRARSIAQPIATALFKAWWRPSPVTA